jgi:hypothetical protein
VKPGCPSWAIVLGLVAGVAACGVATPTPRPPGEPTSSARPSAEPSATADTDSVPPREPTGAFGREIEIGTLDPAWTTTTLEVASDGEAVIFSSGVADGPGAEGAPDLWRYRPGADGPELLWRNPRRDRALIRIGGEFGTWAFVDTGIHGERAWDLWLLPDLEAEPILLDTHPGDRAVSSLVPSFTVHQGQIAWTAFDSGPNGPVSQLLYARAPHWEPVLVAERDASTAELWMPSLRDTELAYCEVIYSPDRSSDERHVYVTNVRTPEMAPRRLDTSGRATMPLLLPNGGVVWKQADPGFSMFNWGHLFRYDEVLAETRSLPTRPQEFVNYPSAGTRFVAAWGADSTAFGVYDLDLETTRLIDRYPSDGDEHVLRPHISGDLLVWTYAIVDGLGHGPPPQVRYAFLPPAGSDRNRD